jgi:C-terminal processing protease CtpA/Prc
LCDSEAGQAAQRTGVRLRVPISIETRILPRNIGYLAINDFGDDQITAIDRAMPAVLTTDALVIDLRNNTAGIRGVGNHLMGNLTDQAFPNSRQIVRHYIPAFRVQRRRLPPKTSVFL